MFIYVFDKDSAERLLSSGFLLVRADRERSLFIFIHNDELAFDLHKDKYILSSTLTF